MKKLLLLTLIRIAAAEDFIPLKYERSLAEKYPDSVLWLL